VPTPPLGEPSEIVTRCGAFRSTSRKTTGTRRPAQHAVHGPATAPRALIRNLSLKDAATFIADRKAAGFNALW
jgi:hypothetical protein